MASLDDTVQFAWDKFDIYERVAIEKVHQGGPDEPIRLMANTRLSIVEAVSESECLMKELQTKRSSGPQPKRQFKIQTYLVMINSLLAELTIFKNLKKNIRISL